MRLFAITMNNIFERVQNYFSCVFSRLKCRFHEHLNNIGPVNLGRPIALGLPSTQQQQQQQRSYKQPFWKTLVLISGHLKTNIFNKTRHRVFNDQDTFSIHIIIILASINLCMLRFFVRNKCIRCAWWVNG